MKKLLVYFLFICGSAFAGDSFSPSRSSFTQTNESGYISSSTRLVAVDVGIASAGGTLKIYNSTWTTNVLISSISLATIQNHYYGDEGIAVSGIFYITGANANGVTIIYKR